MFSSLFFHWYIGRRSYCTSPLAHSQMHKNCLVRSSISASVQWVLCVGVCDCLCRKAERMCGIYRGYRKASSWVFKVCVFSPPPLCFSPLRLFSLSSICARKSLPVFTCSLLFCSFVFISPCKGNKDTVHRWLLIISIWSMTRGVTHAKQTRHQYLEDLHTGWSQLPLWNGDADCPLQVTVKISICGILPTLMSGPVLGQVSVQSCPLICFIHFLLQQQIVVMFS